VAALPGADHVRSDSDPYECCWDFLDHEILDCDERLYVPPDSNGWRSAASARAWRSKSFADPACPKRADAETNPRGRHDCNIDCSATPASGRLFIGVRGNSSLTYVDTSRVADPVLGTRPSFSCTGPKGTDARVCQVTMMERGAGPGSSARPSRFPDEPYALALDPDQDLLYVGNLRADTTHPQTGGISLFDVSSPKLVAPKFLGASAAVFAPDAGGKLRDHVAHATARPPRGLRDLPLRHDVVNVVPSLATDLCHQQAKDIVLFVRLDVFAPPLVAVEIRGIQFLPNTNRAFVLQRVHPPSSGSTSRTTRPPSATSRARCSRPCTAPTFLQANDAGDGKLRLYVTCFDAGTDLRCSTPRFPGFIAVVNAGRGPAGIAFPKQWPSDRKERLAYIVGFSANDISVLDLTPGSATQYHVVQPHRLSQPGAAMTCRAARAQRPGASHGGHAPPGRRGRPRARHRAPGWESRLRWTTWYCVALPGVRSSTEMSLAEKADDVGEALLAIGRPLLGKRDAGRPRPALTTAMSLGTSGSKHVDLSGVEAGDVEAQLASPASLACRKVGAVAGLEHLAREVAEGGGSFEMSTRRGRVEHAGHERAVGVGQELNAADLDAHEAAARRRPERTDKAMSLACW